MKLLVWGDWAGLAGLADRVKLVRSRRFIGEKKKCGVEIKSFFYGVFEGELYSPLEQNTSKRFPPKTKSLNFFDTLRIRGGVNDKYGGGGGGQRGSSPIRAVVKPSSPGERNVERVFHGVSKSGEKKKDTRIGGKGEELILQERRKQVGK